MDTIDRINLCLAKKGIDGAEMSRNLGFSNSVYSQWNTRKTNPSKKKLMLVADYFGVSLEWLMFGEDDLKTKNPTAQTDDEALMFALFGNSKQVTREDLQAVKNYAAFLKNKRESE